MRILLALAPVALAAGCSEPAPAPIVVHDLRAATGAAELKAVGVAVDPTGARYVLDETAGLYRLDGETATLVLPLADFPPPNVPVIPPFTDLAALGPGRFAITAIGDGFILDLAAHTLTSYFCYLPDGLPEDYTQRTDAVAYDAAADRIFAQPRTFDAAGNVVRAQIAEYLGTSGQNVDWIDVDPAIAARGMAVLPDRGLVAADGLRLDVFDGRTLESNVDLFGLGVSSVDGLAFDPVTESVLVVDDRVDVLVEIPLAQLYTRQI
jgi:hypothetical protein